MELSALTLIIGAKCKDGVVLVGDRKASEELNDSYIDKIRRCVGNGQEKVDFAVFGAAGIGSLFEGFLTLLPPKVKAHSEWVRYDNQRLRNQYRKEFETKDVPLNPNLRPPYKTYSATDFVNECVDLLKEMRQRYDIAFSNPSCVLDVLIGMSYQHAPSKLYFISSTDCLPVEIDNIVAIGQSDLAQVFLKPWNVTMDMQRTARLSVLAIRYIEGQKISKEIGVGAFQPQVWFVPNNSSPREIIGEELRAIESDAEVEYKQLAEKMNSLFRF